MTTTTSNKIELIQSTIHKLIDSRNASKSDAPSTNEDDDCYLVVKLLSQLESLKGDVEKPSDTATDSKEVPSNSSSKAGTEIKDEEEETCNKETGHETEDVIKEVKKLGRQNKITHCLLSALMILTVAWQLSEVSILLKLKDGVSHPFRSLGTMVAGVLKAPISDALESEMQLSSPNKHNGTETHLSPDTGLSSLMTYGQE